MKIVLAGACGHLGSDIFRELLNKGHTVAATDRVDCGLELTGDFTFQKLDITEPDTLKGLCDGADAVISAAGLTKASADLTNYDVDYQGNLNLLKEAQSSGAGVFIYVSILNADQASDVPLINAKYLFEQELKKSGMTYIIIRPTGYFYDIVNVFRPMLLGGHVTLLGYKPVRVNMIATEDLAQFIAGHLTDINMTYSIGGSEVYSYEEIANMCFSALGTKPDIKHVPSFIFNVSAWINHFMRNGSEDIIKFSKWTLTHDLIGTTKYGERSFKEYIKESFSV